MSSTGRKGQKVPKDILGRYQTDPRAVDGCLSTLDAILTVDPMGPPTGLAGQTVLDAGCGEGAWTLGAAMLPRSQRPRGLMAVDVDMDALGKMIREFRDLCDLFTEHRAQTLHATPMDFLKYDVARHASGLRKAGLEPPVVTVMNPPFHLTELFLAHALTQTPWVGALIRSTFLSNTGPWDRGLWDRLVYVGHLNPRPGFLSAVYTDEELERCLSPELPGIKRVWTEIPRVSEYKGVGSDSAGYVFVVLGPANATRHPFHFIRWKDMWADKLRSTPDQGVN